MDFKLYGLCIERLKHQIKLADKRRESAPMMYNGRMVLEGYETSDIDEIVDLLELYDLKERRLESLMEKLEEIAENASLLVRRKIGFGFDEAGHLCLYLFYY
ncbi:MAG: hypothetical protein D6726_08020 [Nitrospirae bacterium]|nr:MAG: hypothetical protein D6726_08020 [Nitrospirota bacterium]